MCKENKRFIFLTIAIWLGFIGTNLDMLQKMVSEYKGIIFMLFYLYIALFISSLVEFISEIVRLFKELR